MKRNRAWVVALGVGLSTTSVAAAWATRAPTNNALAATTDTLVAAASDVSADPNPTLSAQTTTQTPRTVIRYVDVYEYVEKPGVVVENPNAIAADASPAATATSRPKVARKKVRHVRPASTRVRTKVRTPAATASGGTHSQEGDGDDD